MQIDAFGHVFDTEAPDTVDCTACDGHAERLSSAWQGEGIVYHNYLCRDDCPAGGTIVEHDDGDERRVGPVFRAPHTREPTRRDDHPANGVVRTNDKQAAEAREVHP